MLSFLLTNKDVPNIPLVCLFFLETDSFKNVIHQRNPFP